MTELAIDDARLWTDDKFLLGMVTGMVPEWISVSIILNPERTAAVCSPAERIYDIVLSAGGRSGRFQLWTGDFGADLRANRAELRDFVAESLEYFLLMLEESHG